MTACATCCTTGSEPAQPVHKGGDVRNGALKSDYVEIGTEESSRLELTPAKLCVAKTIRHKVILKSELEDKQPEERKIMIAPMPLMPVSKSMAGASVLADIIIGKFMYHLPFYRQIQQYKEHGVSISASTMGGWYEASVERLERVMNGVSETAYRATSCSIMTAAGVTPMWQRFCLAGMPA